MARLAGQQPIEVSLRRNHVHRADVVDRPVPGNVGLAAVGDETDRQRVEELLDAQDDDLRRAAAEGLAFAGELEPLLERVADPQIYPFVIRLIAAGPVDVKTVRSLAALVPPEAVAWG